MSGRHDPSTSPVCSGPILIGSQSGSRAPDPLAALGTPAHRHSIEGDFRLRLLGHVGGCRRLLAFVFQWSAAERAVGRRLGVYRHSGILRGRVASSKWSLTLLAAGLLGIVDATLFGKWSSLTMLGPFQPLV